MKNSNSSEALVSIGAVVADSMSDWCRRRGYSRTTAYEEIKAGTLRTVKVGKSRYVPRAEILRQLSILNGEIAINDSEGAA